MKIKDLRNVIKKEIAWCRKNGSGLDRTGLTDIEKGFIKGLKQTLFFVGKGKR